MSKHMFGRQIMAAYFLAAVGVMGVCAFAQSPGTTYPGITAPSDQKGMNFNMPGQVMKLTVKEGDEVKKGMLVAQQDDTVDLAEWIAKEAEAKSSALQYKAATADLDQKKVELVRSQNMFAKNVLGKSELEKAELDVKIGEVRVDLAIQETDQKKKEALAQKAKVDQKKLISTVDGIVQKINVHEGELATNDPKTPCMQIVSNEPLFVEVDVPVAESKTLEKGMKMEVKYTDETTWVVAPIIYLNPVANSAAGTQRVRLELANTRTPRLRSGLQVDVRFLQKGVAVAQPGK